MPRWLATLLRRPARDSDRAARLALFEIEAEILDQRALIEMAMTEPDPVLAGKAAAELKRRIFGGAAHA